ncbi:hypothetical protein [Campylobacter sp.]|uniref:hypothetical protein n=1 Tax=Campylobacter sp. TaxID=205 RepID=UPI002A7F8BC0|nr:hypothetical protein [Campylobacter sp.]MDY4803298.1 hypothetical protein [Campylobacter sp.]
MPAAIVATQAGINENEKVRVNVVLARFVLDEMKARNLNRSQLLTNLAVEALSI